MEAQKTLKVASRVYNVGRSTASLLRNNFSSSTTNLSTISSSKPTLERPVSAIEPSTNPIIIVNDIESPELDEQLVIEPPEEQQNKMSPDINTIKHNNKQSANDLERLLKRGIIKIKKTTMSDKTIQQMEDKIVQAVKEALVEGISRGLSVPVDKFNETVNIIYSIIWSSDMSDQQTAVQMLFELFYDTLKNGQKFHTVYLDKGLIYALLKAVRKGGSMLTNQIMTSVNKPKSTNQESNDDKAILNDD